MSDLRFPNVTSLMRCSLAINTSRHVNILRS